MKSKQSTLAVSSAALCATALVSFAPAVKAQGISGGPFPVPNMVPAQMIAQQAPSAPADLQPIDLTPVNLPNRGGAFNTLQQARINALYKLPSKMFINVNVENSVRLETNAFQTASHNKADGVYRVIPDTTVGYAFNRTTRVAANYFMFRDTYFDYAHELSRTVHSVGLSAQHDIVFNPTTWLTTSLMGRELFITRQKSLCDILPSLSLVHRHGQYGAMYASVLGQIRWQDMIGSKFQEGDQFYSIGYNYRRPMWGLLADTTLIDNFGHGYLRPGPNSNHIIVITLEANRRLSRTIPVLAFVRAQPIFNMGANSTPGYAGFNLRLFGGLRLELSKPPLFPVKLRST